MTENAPQRCRTCNTREPIPGGLACAECVALAREMNEMMAAADREREAAAAARAKPKSKPPGRLADDLDKLIPGVPPVPQIGPAPVAPLVTVRPKPGAILAAVKKCHQCEKPFTPTPGGSPVRCESCVKENRNALRRFKEGGR